MADQNRNSGSKQGDGDPDRGFDAEPLGEKGSGSTGGQRAGRDGGSGSGDIGRDPSGGGDVPIGSGDGESGFGASDVDELDDDDGEDLSGESGSGNGGSKTR